MWFPSRLQAGQWLKSIALVQRSAAIWRCSAFIAWTALTLAMTLSHDDSTINVVRRNLQCKTCGTTRLWSQTSSTWTTDDRRRAAGLTQQQKRYSPDIIIIIIIIIIISANYSNNYQWTVDHELEGAALSHVNLPGGGTFLHKKG